MGKITPTFADNTREGHIEAPKVRGRKPNGVLTPQIVATFPTPPHIVAQHEPLSETKGSIIPPLPELPPSPPVAVPAAQEVPLKVALVGTAPSSRLLAPFADPSWKIWACSPGNMGALPRVDAWFEIHANYHWPECRSYGEPYIKWLKEQTFPIYMQDQMYLPNAITFPKDELVKEFGRYFFTSSFTWMMAFAIKMGVKEIALYGIDMASRDEYILQRPGAYFFFHEAARRGVKIIAPHESDIMQPPALYGYSEVTPFGRKVLARISEIKERLAGMRQQRDQLVHNITYLEGALEDLDYIHSIWLGQG